MLLFYQSLQRYATCAIHQSTRPAQKFLVYSDRHLYSMYFQRIGGRSVAHTNIRPAQSPPSRAFNRSAHVTPLPSRPRPKKEYCRADSSSFRIGVLSIFYTHPNIHRFLHLPRSLVYIYTRQKSAYRRVTWGSGGYLPTSPLRLNIQDGAESDRLYQSSGGTHVRIFSHTFFKIQIFVWALSEPPGLDAHIFEPLSSRHLP